jgi:hypothetical protein
MTPLEGEGMIRDIDALNEEMEAAGARVFAAGLENVSLAKSLRKQTDKTISFHRIGYRYAPFGTRWLVPKHIPEGYAGWNLPPGPKQVVGRMTLTAGLMTVALTLTQARPATVPSIGLQLPLSRRSNSPVTAPDSEIASVTGPEF